jgi:hypothetical protein
MSTSSDTSVEASQVSSIAPATTVREQDAMVPRGAIAFFVAMLVAFAVIWLGMYEILVVRQNGL